MEYDEARKYLSSHAKKHGCVEGCLEDFENFLENGAPAAEAAALALDEWGIIIDKNGKDVTPKKKR